MANENPNRTLVLARAFTLVEPKGPGRSWKDPIDWSASTSALEAVCEQFQVTLDDISEAIVHYTATEAIVQRQSVTFGAHQVEMVRITAAGYRAGPAGDH